MLAELTVVAFAFAQMASADDWFVTTNGDDTVAGTNWATALLTISNAVAKTSDGDTITVSNGTYNIDAQIAVSKEITLQSVNGATNTIVNRSAIGTNAPQHRIFYLNHANAVVDGFTITNGYLGGAGIGGGVYTTAGTLRNCTLTGNSAEGNGGGAYGGTLYNCTLTGNSMTYNTVGPRDGGGGAYGSTLFNCTIVNNSSADAGGGAYGGSLTNCTIVGNSATHGGGTYNATLYNCTIVSNSADYCAGASGGTRYNCTLSYNSAVKELGGGAYNGTLYNCLLIGNSASVGGGARDATLRNCTIVGNSATSNGGGVRDSTLHNCISWGNNKVDSGATYYYSCAAGITGEGTITSDPLFIADGSGYGASHVPGNYRLLRKESPCINTGTNFSWMTPPGVCSKDLDGLPRIDNFTGHVDMGCYELLHTSGTIIKIH